MPELNAKLFGTPAVSVDGREITLPYKKADALLYYLILKRKTTRSECSATRFLRNSDRIIEKK